VDYVEMEDARVVGTGPSSDYVNFWRRTRTSPVRSRNMTGRLPRFSGPSKSSWHCQSRRQILSAISIRKS